jgi:hypothetical protein
VGRTSTEVDVVSEDPTALGKAVVGEDSTALGEDPVVVGGQGDMEANEEEEQACSMDPAAVGEAIGEAAIGEVVSRRSARRR